MAGLVDTQIRDSYKSVLRVNDNTNGIDSSLEVVEDGAGTDSPIKVSTTNVTVLDHQVNTQYAYFGVSSGAQVPTVVDTHYAIPFSTMALNSGYISLGTDPNPATVLDLSSINQSDDLVTCLWYIPDDITIDNVYVWAGSSGATGDSLTYHLMSYIIDFSDNAAGDGGDLSSGTVIADHTGTVDSDGYEATIFKSLTIQSANIDAGRVGIFTMAGDATHSDVGLNVTVKYHLR